MDRQNEAEETKRNRAAGAGYQPGSGQQTDVM